MSNDSKITIETVKIIRAFKPGDIVFLECDRHLSADEANRLREILDTHVPEVKIILLPPHMRVAAREETSTSSTLDQEPG